MPHSTASLLGSKAREDNRNTTTTNNQQQKKPTSPEVKRSLRNFPKRDELSLRIVRAFPKDSRIGDDSSTLCSRFSSGAAERLARYLSAFEM